MSPLEPNATAGVEFLLSPSLTMTTGQGQPTASDHPQSVFRALGARRLVLAGANLWSSTAMSARVRLTSTCSLATHFLIQI